MTRVIQRRLFILLIAAFGLLCLLAGAQSLPAAAPALALSVQPKLFWYWPQLTTNLSPQRISSIAFDPATPSVALASEGNAGGTMLRTRDHGLTWSPLAGWNPTDQRFAFRVIYGGVPQIYYAWGGVQIYKTIDSGDTWTPVAYNYLCNQIVTLAVQPASPAALYVGTTNRFARSLDGGQTWDSPSPTPCGGGPHAFTIGVGVDQPNILYAGEFYNYGGGVYRSADRGLTWENRSTGLPLQGGFLPSVIRVLIDPRNADIVYALTEQGQVYRTSNAGGQWNLFVQGIESVQLTSMLLDTAHDNHIYGASTDHMYVLADGAQTWELLDTEPIPQVSSFPYKIGLQIDPATALRPITYSDNGLFVGLPIPTISKLTPDTAVAGQQQVALTVDGSGFTPGTLVRWNGAERPTTFVNDTRLSAMISATDVLTPSVVPITVGYHRNYPAASDGASNVLPFTITSVCAVDGHVVLNGACAMTVTPGAVSTLVYTSTASLVMTIDVPADSVTATTVLSYTAVPTATAPAGFAFAGLAFSLDAYQGDAKLEGFAFARPISVTVQYGDADVIGMNEQSLTLDYWNGTAWVDAATTCSPPSVYQRAPNVNRFSVALCHLTQFGVFGSTQHKLRLPLVRQ